MLMSQSLVKLLEMWDKGLLPGLDGDLIRDELPLVLFQALSRTLQRQRASGFWGRTDSPEETAYSLLAVAALASLPFVRPVDEDIENAIRKGRSALDSFTGAISGAEYLWIEKVTYSSPILCETYILAALNATNQLEKPVYRKQPTDLINMKKVNKFLPFYQKLLTIGTLPAWRIRISLMEGCLFAPFLSKVRYQVFPARSTDNFEEKYWDNIRFTWCCVNSIDLTFASADYIVQWMTISYLNYQGDEYMEAVVGTRFSHNWDAVRVVIEDVFKPEPSWTDYKASIKAKSNGILTNGHASSGVASNGTTHNATTSEGAATNGISNGAATNGISNGASAHGPPFDNEAKANSTPNDESLSNGVESEATTKHGVVSNDVEVEASTNGTTTNGDATTNGTTTDASHRRVDSKLDVEVDATNGATIDELDLQEIRRVLTLLNDWTFTHSQVLRASPYQLKETKHEMKMWILGHLIQAEDSVRLARQKTYMPFETPTSNFYNWVSHVSADHTSVSHFHSFLVALPRTGRLTLSSVSSAPTPTNSFSASSATAAEMTHSQPRSRNTTRQPQIATSPPSAAWKMTMAPSSATAPSETSTSSTSPNSSTKAELPLHPHSRPRKPRPWKTSRKPSFCASRSTSARVTEMRCGGWMG